MAETVIVPRRREDFFDNNGDPTLRFIRFLESLTNTTNETVIISVDQSEEIQENTDDIASLKSSISANTYSQIQFLQQQIDGLPEFTIDTTGFTVDSTLITADKVVA